MNAASFGFKKMSDFKTFQESQHHVYVTLYEDVLLILHNSRNKAGQSQVITRIIHIRKPAERKRLLLHITCKVRPVFCEED